MCSISTRLFLNTLPFTCRYKRWYLGGGREGGKEEGGREGGGREGRREGGKGGGLEFVRRIYYRMLNSQMTVNLLGFPILAEQSSQCPHPPHPDYLLRKSGICCTLPFTIAYGRGEVEKRCVARKEEGGKRKGGRGKGKEQQRKGRRKKEEKEEKEVVGKRTCTQIH